MAWRRNLDSARLGTGGYRRQLPSGGSPPFGRQVERPANVLRVLGLAGVFAVAFAPAVRGQTWFELIREMAEETPGESDHVPPASVGNATLDLEWVGGRESRRLDGVLADLAWLDDAGAVVMPDGLVSLNVASGGSGATLGWPEAAELLAGVLVHRQLMDQTLPAEMHPVQTGGGTVQVPQPFIRSTQMASLGLLERLLKDRSVRRKLFAEAALRALTLDEAKRYDSRLGSSLASSVAAAPTLLGATDAAASAGVNTYAQLRIIAGEQAAQHAARGGDVAATVQGRVSRSGLGRSTQALGVLAYGVGLVENLADARARNRLLLAAAEHALAIRGLDDAQRLLAAAGSDSAMVAGLADAVAELTQRSQSRLARYVTMGGEAAVDSAVPTLGMLAAGAVGSGGLALVLQQAADLSEQLADYVGAVLTVSAMATIGEDLRSRTEALVSGDEVGGTGAADYAVRELMGLQRRLAAEATASVYSILWRDRWSRATSLGGLGRAAGLTLAEWFTGDEHTQEAFAQEVEWRVGQVRQSAEFSARLPDILARLRWFYSGPADDVEETEPRHVHRGPELDSATPPRAVFTEDWAAGAIDPLQWVTFGSPTSRIVGSFQGYPEVFDNNGDANHESGAVTNRTFDLGPEWVSIEADVYLDYWNAGGCWAGAMIGLADPDVPPSRLDRFEGVGLSFTFHVEGDACWATPPEHRRKVWFSGGFRRLGGGRERIPPFSVEGTAYANRWGRMRIAIHPNGRVSLFMDDERLWTSVGAVDPALRWNHRLVLGNRSSGSAGKAYIDNLEVWAYQDARATNR